MLLKDLLVELCVSISVNGVKCLPIEFLKLMNKQGRCEMTHARNNLRFGRDRKNGVTNTHYFAMVYDIFRPNSTV